VLKQNKRAKISGARDVTVTCLEPLLWSSLSSLVMEIEVVVSYEVEFILLVSDK
jgi:hypothetical protein